MIYIKIIAYIVEYAKNTLVVIIKQYLGIYAKKKILALIELRTLELGKVKRATQVTTNFRRESYYIRAVNTTLAISAIKSTKLLYVLL